MISSSECHKFNIPWAQLTLLNLTGSIFLDDHCLGIMQECPMLKSCSFAIIDPAKSNELYQYENARFTHHYLELLDLCTRGDFREFFGRLTLPHLRELSVEMGYFENSRRIWPQSQFLEFLTRSECAFGMVQCRHNTTGTDRALEILISFPLEFASFCGLLTVRLCHGRHPGIINHSVDRSECVSVSQSHQY